MSVDITAEHFSVQPCRLCIPLLFAYSFRFCAQISYCSYSVRILTFKYIITPDLRCWKELS